MPYRVLYRDTAEELGHSVEVVDSIREAREFIRVLATDMADGSFLYIRYTPAYFKHGYYEPNQEAYRVTQGVPRLIWRDRKHRGMDEAIQGKYGQYILDRLKREDGSEEEREAAIRKFLELE